MITIAVHRLNLPHHYHWNLNYLSQIHFHPRRYLMRLIVHCPFSAYGLSGDCDSVPQWVALHFSPPHFSSLLSKLAVRALLLLLPAGVESSSPDLVLPVLRIQLQLPRCSLSFPSDAFRRMGQLSKMHYVHTSIFECN